MDQRIASVLILVEDRRNVSDLNSIISEYAEIVIGRQGISLINNNRSVISLVIEGTTDQIGGLTGKLGRLVGIKVKSLVIKDN